MLGDTGRKQRSRCPVAHVGAEDERNRVERGRLKKERGAPPRIKWTPGMLRKLSVSEREKKRSDTPPRRRRICAGDRVKMVTGARTTHTRDRGTSSFPQHQSQVNATKLNGQSCLERVFLLTSPPKHTTASARRGLTPHPLPTHTPFTNSHHSK